MITDTQLASIESRFLDNNQLIRPKLPPDQFFAPELSQELLVNHLARKHPVNPDRPYNNDDLSIAFRAGISNSEIQLHHSLVNKHSTWTISGLVRYFDIESSTILFPVVLSTNRILELHSQGADNEHAIHLAVLRYLYFKQTGINVNVGIIAVDRLFTNYKPMPTKLLNFIPINDYHSHDTIEQMLITRTTELNQLSITNSQPSICSGFRWHRKHGKSINMSCAHYCSYNHVCKHYSKQSTNFISKDSIIF